MNSNHKSAEMYFIDKFADYRFDNCSYKIRNLAREYSDNLAIYAINRFDYMFADLHPYFITEDGMSSYLNKVKDYLREQFGRTVV